MVRVVTAVLVLALVVLVFLFTTPRTGFPGPGPLRRFREDDLRDLSERINRDGVGGCDTATEPLARVDWLLGRVVIRNAGLIGWRPTDAERPMIANPERILADVFC